MQCKCGGNVEFTLVKDEATGVILLKGDCSICGKSATGYGFTVEEALEEVKKSWVRKRRKKKCT